MMQSRRRLHTCIRAVVPVRCQATQLRRMVLPFVLALLAASCADIGDLFGPYGRLHEVRQRVAAVPGGADATVTLADQRHLTIALRNDAIAMATIALPSCRTRGATNVP